MDKNKNYPKNADLRPKRRKDKDNPYTIYSIGSETDHPKYFARFTDREGIDHCLEINKELFELMNEFELDDLSHLNEIDRHYAAENTDANNDNYSMPDNSVEEQVVRSLEYSALYDAIKKLPPVQRHRLEMRYFEEKTYIEIASADNCSKQTAQESVAAAQNNLKKLLKNFSE